jgi:hypothetical protein
VAQLNPQALGTHFNGLLRHAWVTVGLLCNPGHSTGSAIVILLQYSHHVVFLHIYHAETDIRQNSIILYVHQLRGSDCDTGLYMVTADITEAMSK